MGGQDGAGEGVLTLGFQRRGDGQHLVLAVAGRGGHFDNGGLVAGQGAGLVQGDRADAAEGFQRGAALDQYAQAGGGADGGDHGDRHADGQRARRGGHEHDQGAFDPGQRIPGQAADEGDGGGEDHDAGHQRLGDAVGQALGDALAGLLGLHDGHDLGQGVVRGGGGDLDLEYAGAVDRSRIHALPGFGLDGDRFAGQRGDVQGGAAGADHAVGGQPLAGPYQQHLTQAQLGRVHAHLGAVAQHGGRLRHQRQQRAQPAPGAHQRVLLQPFADRVQERQHGGLGDLPKDDRADGGDRHQRADADLALGQPSQRAGHECPAADRQRESVQADRDRRARPGQARQPPGEQEHPGRAGELQLAHLPQPFRLPLFGLVLPGRLRICAASARITHRPASSICW